MRLLGIDPGVSGGLAWRDTATDATEVRPMPVDGDGLVDIGEIQRWLDHIGTPERAFLEEQRHRQGDNAANSYKGGRNWGRLEALLLAYEIPFLIVRPQVWQRELGTSCTRPPAPKGETKQAEARRLREHKKKLKGRAAAFCARWHPTVSIRPESGKGSKSYHDGMSDALCILAYGERIA